MAAEHTHRRYGKVFDAIAAEYDRSRPTYPDEIVDRACEAAGLTGGEEVLEIGCGTGQLTRSLLARGLRVTAVEPGQRLVALAAQRLGQGGGGARTHGSGVVEFVNARLEDARLATGRFRAAFSASAFHWVDPDVSWRIVADTLAPGGTLALLQYFAARDPSSPHDDERLRELMRAIVPEIVAEMSPPRDLSTLLTEVARRRDNVSEVWAWLGSYDLARGYAARLFSEVRVATLPVLIEQPAPQLNAFFRTTSLYRRLPRDKREAVERANLELGERLGRPIRSGTVAIAVTARRSPSP